MVYGLGTLETTPGTLFRDLHEGPNTWLPLAGQGLGPAQRGPKPPFLSVSDRCYGGLGQLLRSVTTRHVTIEVLDVSGPPRNHLRTVVPALHEGPNTWLPLAGQGLGPAQRGPEPPFWSVSDRWFRMCHDGTVLRVVVGAFPKSGSKNISLKRAI